MIKILEKACSLITIPLLSDQISFWFLLLSLAALFLLHEILMTIYNPTNANVVHSEKWI